MRGTLPVLLVLLAAGAAAAGDRREARPDPAVQANPLESVLADEPPPPSYRSDQRGRELWHQAIRDFHAGRSWESEAAFGLAYRRSPKDPGLVLDYAFCSVLFPEKQRSLRRALALHQEAVRLLGGPTPRTSLLEGLILWENGEKDRGRECLLAAREDLPGLCDPMLARIAVGEPVLADLDLARRIVPLRRQSNRLARAGR